MCWNVEYKGKLERKRTVKEGKKEGTTWIHFTASEATLLRSISILSFLLPSVSSVHFIKFLHNNSLISFYTPAATEEVKRQVNMSD